MGTYANLSLQEHQALLLLRMVQKELASTHYAIACVEMVGEKTPMAESVEMELSAIENALILFLDL